MLETVENFFNRRVIDNGKYGKNRKSKDLIKGIRHFDRIDRVAIICEKFENSEPDKIAVIDLLRFKDNQEERIRFGYFIRANKGDFKWGQNMLSISRVDTQKLLALTN